MVPGHPNRQPLGVIYVNVSGHHWQRFDSHEAACQEYGNWKARLEVNLEPDPLLV